jgi:hypothetical protein
LADALGRFSTTNLNEVKKVTSSERSAARIYRVTRRFAQDDGIVGGLKNKKTSG